MVKKYKGINSADAPALREKYGTNSLLRIRGKGLLRRFFENLSDPIIKILLIALAIEVIFTFGNCNLIEVFGIVAAILIATSVSTLSEYGSEKAFQKMEEDSGRTFARVIRDGKLQNIAIDEVVVGDIVLLSAGESICADGSVLEGSLTVDQSSLNGENIEAEKAPAKEKGWDLLNKSKLFRGSVVASGSCVMRVERVGDATYYGMVAKDVQAETRLSPLKLRLSKLASQISKIGYVVAALVGITYLFNSVVADNGFKWELIKESVSDPVFILSSLLHALTMMITVVVVAVPEGLPMMITVVLSANMKRMIKDNILVKKLVGIETAGSLNILFTDKTGTLTTGKLSVDRVIGEEGTLKGVTGFDGNDVRLELLRLCASYNSDVIVTDEGFSGGNATDRAFVEFFWSKETKAKKIHSRMPFSSEIKYSSVTFDTGETIVKGAAEVILSKCKFYIKSDGRIVASDLKNVREEFNKALNRGERAIAVAIKNEGSESLILISLVILKDKIRDGVKEAVKQVLQAGIQIVMVTGDNKDTATSIAEECGFFRSKAGHIAISSSDLANMTDEEVKRILPSIRVVARALPQDKTRLVRLSQELELVAGMTGDGINDAPSLKLADVGFAMGSGTDIAKCAGDIVILDNSFKSISKTVLYGRTIFKSIRKFITFQLIMNVAACGITLIGQFLGIDNPITIIQMLWVNIIMDTLGGLAFAGEPPLDYYMKEKPKRRDEPILNSSMLSHIALNGIFTLFILVLFLKHPYFEAFYSGGTGKLLTAFYALFIFAGIFNSFTARCERLWLFSNIGKNKPFIFIMLFISVIQVLIIYFGGTLFRSTPLLVGELSLAILLSFSVILFDGVRRIFDKLK